MLTEKTPYCVLVAAASENDRAMLRALLELMPDTAMSIAVQDDLDALEERLVEDTVDAAVVVLPQDAQGRTELLRRMLEIGRAPLVLVGATEDLEFAVAAMRMGAADYLVKSRLSSASLLHAIRGARDRWDPAVGCVRPTLARCERHRTAPSDNPTEGRLPPEAPPRAPPVVADASTDPQVEADAASHRAQIPLIRAYSTTGIDAAMSKMGIQRPRLLSDVLAEARRDAAAILAAVCRDAHPVNYGLLVKIASVLRKHVVDIRDCNAAFAYRFAPVDYFGGNAVNVALTAHILAQSAGLSEELDLQIMVAALLHDVGLLANHDDAPSIVPVSKELTEHCRRGARLAREIGAPALVSDIILQHEEHADGSGLPDMLPGEQIKDEAQYVLVGVTYSDLLYRRFLTTAGSEAPRYRGVLLEIDDPLGAILHSLRAWFKPGVLRRLILEAGFYSVGMLVQLTNGNVARVVAQNPGKPTSPVVEVVYRADGTRPDDISLLDLAGERALQVTKVLSFEQIPTEDSD